MNENLLFSSLGEECGRWVDRKFQDREGEELWQEVQVEGCGLESQGLESQVRLSLQSGSRSRSRASITPKEEAMNFLDF